MRLQLELGPTGARAGALPKPERSPQALEYAKGRLKDGITSFCIPAAQGRG